VQEQHRRALALLDVARAQGLDGDELVLRAGAGNGVAAHGRLLGEVGALLTTEVNGMSVAWRAPHFGRGIGPFRMDERFCKSLIMRDDSRFH
jgi:hypothetical protein